MKNFHFRMLIGLAATAMVLSFIYSFSALHNSSDRIGAPISGVFSMLAFGAAITAQAIRSINRRLDQAGLPEENQAGTSEKSKTDLS
ncbi:MAG: hypothetical protein ABIT37_14165 [Luteolibacter sp.]